ncbi:MAG: ribosome maturation factor RimP [Candidatus Sulfobium sp.]
MEEELTKKISGLAESVASEYGVRLVDVEFAGSLRKPTVRVFVEKNEGVTLDDCEKVSRALSALLDVEDPIHRPYVLEVSSPGLDRPLKRLRDFEENVGKLARVVTSESIGGRNFFVGRIKGVKDGDVSLLLEGGEEIEVPFEQMSRARLEIEF